MNGKLEVHALKWKVAADGNKVIFHSSFYAHPNCAREAFGRYTGRGGEQVFAGTVGNTRAHINVYYADWGTPGDWVACPICHRLFNGEEEADRFHAEIIPCAGE